MYMSMPECTWNMPGCIGVCQDVYEYAKTYPYIFIIHIIYKLYIQIHKMNYSILYILLYTFPIYPLTPIPIWGALYIKYVVFSISVLHT